MTAFRHDDASPPDSAWLTGRLDATPWLEPPAAGDHLVVLAAHPDDETLGAGGLISVAHSRGARVSVIVASDGEASHPRSPTHSSQALATRRRAEVVDAVSRLAPGTSVSFLGLPDGGLAHEFDTLLGRVGAVTSTATHLCAPWSGDRHPDHAACAGVAAHLAGRMQIPCWQYPIWAWHWADPDAADALPWQTVARVRLGAQHQLAKREALAAHVSQHSALSEQAGDEAILQPDFVRHFARAFETFVVSEVDDASTPGFFDRLYAAAEDPWGLGSRFYELRKRAVLLASLPRARFGRTFEPGCATGLLTVELAKRSREVVAWDVAARAVDATARRLVDAAHVHVGCGSIPEQWPDGEFDLVVLSEVGYYCRDVRVLADRAWRSLSADGVLVACHWRHPAREHPQTAEAVHRALDRPDRRVVSHLEDDFRLDVWTATGRSVADETGVVG